MKEIIGKFKKMPFSLKLAIAFLTMFALGIFVVAPFVMAIVFIVFGMFLSIVRIIHYLVEGQ